MQAKIVDGDGRLVGSLDADVGVGIGDVRAGDWVVDGKGCEREVQRRVFCGNGVTTTVHLVVMVLQEDRDKDAESARKIAEAKAAEREVAACCERVLQEMAKTAQRTPLLDLVGIAERVVGNRPTSILDAVIAALPRLLEQRHGAVTFGRSDETQDQTTTVKPESRQASIFDQRVDEVVAAVKADFGRLFEELLRESPSAKRALAVAVKGHAKLLGATDDTIANRAVDKILEAARRK